MVAPIAERSVTSNLSAFIALAAILSDRIVPVAILPPSITVFPLSIVVTPLI